MEPISSKQVAMAPITILNVLHRTRYCYAEPVAFGPHHMMMRPRDSHDLRPIDTALTISPAASVRWLHDVFGNSVAVAEFTEPGSELLVESSFRAEHFPLPEAAVAVEAYARHHPFSYAPVGTRQRARSQPQRGSAGRRSRRAARRDTHAPAPLP
jgi:Bacterial transglutaminase-like N-terminal region